MKAAKAGKKSALQHYGTGSGRKVLGVRIKDKRVSTRGLTSRGGKKGGVARRQTRRGTPERNADLSPASGAGVRGPRLASLIEHVVGEKTRTEEEGMRENQQGLRCGTVFLHKRERDQRSEERARA